MDLKEYRIKNKKFVRHPWEVARIDIIKYLLNKFCNKQKVNILDIGTGDGYCLTQICNNFPKSRGIGFDIALTEEEIKQINKNIKSQNKDIVITNQQKEVECFCKQNKIDVFCLMDVLEHIKEDKIFLQECIKNYNLGKDTLFLITVPAFESLFSNHDNYLKHYRRYDKQQLEMLIHSQNIEIKESGYFFFSLLIVRLFVCFKEKIFKLNKNFKSTGNWCYGKFFAKLISKILYFDFLCFVFFKKFGFYLPGLSIYIVAKMEK